MQYHYYYQYYKTPCIEYSSLKSPHFPTVHIYFSTLLPTVTNNYFLYFLAARFHLQPANFAILLQIGGE